MRRASDGAAAVLHHNRSRCDFGYRLIYLLAREIASPRAKNSAFPKIRRSAEGPAVFERRDPVLLLEHPRKIVLIGEPGVKCDLGDAPVPAQQQRRRFFEAAVDEEPVRRQSEPLPEEPPEMRRRDVAARTSCWKSPTWR